MVFSEAINQFNYTHGLSLEERTKLNYTLFTVEEQTAYLSELTQDDTFTITIYIYDYNEKSLHFFSVMSNQDGSSIATSEVMMFGMDRTVFKTAHLLQSI